jgi:hypothetical protein
MKIALLTLAAVAVGIGLFFVTKLLPFILVGGAIVAILYWKLSQKRSER